MSSEDDMTQLIINLLSLSESVKDKRSSVITLSEIINDQIESGLRYDINERRQNLQRSLTTAKHHQIVLDELFGELKRAGGDVYQVLQLRLQSPEGENNSL